MRKIQRLFLLLIIVPYHIFSDDSMDRDNENSTGKRLHVYSSLYNLSSYENSFARKRTENLSLSFLLRVKENFFLGLTFNSGEESKREYRSLPSFYPGFSQIGEFSNSRYGDYLMFRSQFFFYDNFYSSINFGMEKGFTLEQKNFFYFGPSIEYQPYSKITTFSNRTFGTIGIGYRKEIFEFLLLGFELEYGILNSGKIKEHYTFDPIYFNGLPVKIRQDLLFENQYNIGNTDFSFLSIYAGIAF